MTRNALCGVAAVSLLLAGCSTHAASREATPTELPSSTVRVPRHVDQSDRPQVTFDPCLDIPDSTLTAAGYDPTSEKNADFTGGSYTFLGCSYDSFHKPEGFYYGMNVLSGNISFAEEQEKKKDHSTPIEINGRRALLIFDSTVRDYCELSVETPYGVLGFTRSIFADHAGPVSVPEWCGGLEDTARTYEPLIPKED
ncbi:uncharacterized protein DUF3558 [Rhodococcus wratislaviensis]|uniref:Protein of uncharacterized function (DUF3558) n=1 Tax=Rhodococcus wratislaviensis TaxID=44752 RepID=A0AB38FPG5_RHOWR|nr:DUF3558 domain-containing protein [Rhodococcus wratislaviensis]REE75869.1 uncharacterized protein DUF3558 [Rhodococcus wratislaviensis]SPZ43573.1 Protein of uncharacterised function (DUF3558) [Rhodococcus wratislaviensis]